MESSTLYLAYHLTLFIVLVIFYFYTVYKTINEHRYETCILILLTLGVAFKIIYDWEINEDVSLHFAFSSAIIPIYFTCFEFSYRHYSTIL